MPAQSVSPPEAQGSPPSLVNRVDPFGVLFATAARGTLMGNRGGRFHDDSRALGRRRWVSWQWIACLCAFNGRRRTVWGDSYTELFFLDEPTALAAGHRPCFECRRADALAFQAAWTGGCRRAALPTAAAMDAVLHAERLVGRHKRRHIFVLDDLPDGAMIVDGAGAFAVRQDRLLPWSPSGYGEAVPRPRDVIAEVLTPPAILRVLANGYRPLWHASAALWRPSLAPAVSLPAPNLHPANLRQVALVGAPAAGLKAFAHS